MDTLPWRSMDGDSGRMTAELSELPADDERKRAVGKAMALLVGQDRTVKKLQDCLYRAGFSEKASEFAVRYMSGLGYVDDLRYAINYISFHKGNRSRKELRYKLMDKGISHELLAEAFQGYVPEDEYQALRHQMHKRLKGNHLSEMDCRGKDRIMAYLARKGYAISSIHAAMREQERMERDG